MTMTRLMHCYKLKKRRTVSEGNSFNLTIEEYSQLLDDAGITADDIGNKGHQYVLGRKNAVTGECDVGPYEVGNCRFITKAENCKEAINPQQGVAHCPIKAKRISDTMTGTKKSDQHKENIRKSKLGKLNPMYGRTNKLSVVECPHCGKTGALNLMNRYHFDKCKELK